MIKVLLITSMALAAQLPTKYYVRMHPNDQVHYVMAKRGPAPDDAICEAPKDNQGAQVVYAEDLNISVAMKQCTFSPSKRAARLQADTDKRNADRAKEQKAEAVRAELKAKFKDIESMTTAQLKSLIKSLVLRVEPEAEESQE